MNIFILLISLLSLPAFATRIDVSHLEEDDKEFVNGISRCTPQETAVLQNALAAVSVRLNQLNTLWYQYTLAAVKQSFVIPENRRWIEGSILNQRYHSYWSVMRDSLQKMSSENINIRCEIASDRTCRNGGTLAYVKFFLGKPLKLIHICPILFQNPQLAVNATLLHELSHYSVSTEDYAGDWWNRNNIEIERASKDAYHIERFMNEDPKNVLKGQIWFWWWPKQGSNTLLLKQRVK